MANFTWKTATSGNWSDTSNWMPTGVPDTGDNASITMPGSYTVTLDDDFSPENLTFNDASGTLDIGSHQLGVDTSTTFTAGTITMEGGAFFVGGNGMATSVGATLMGWGVVNDAITGPGTVVATSSHTLELVDEVTDSATHYEVQPNATLQVDDLSSDNVTFSFLGSTGKVTFQDNADFNRTTISGLVAGNNTDQSTTNLVDLPFLDFSDVTVEMVSGGAGASGEVFIKYNMDQSKLTFFLTNVVSNGHPWQVEATPDGNSGTDVFVAIDDDTTPGPAFSPETAGTNVFTAEYGSAPSASELTVLSQFAQSQFDYGKQIGVMDPSVYAYQSLGVALATGPHFQAEFGPTNPVYPVSTVGDVQFVDAAYASVFGHAGTAAQIQVFVDQLNFIEGLYTAAGTFGSPSNIDLLARGAIYGQMLGIEHEAGVGAPPPGPVFSLTQGQDTIALDQSGSAVTGTFGAADATWTPGDTITATPGTADESFNIQGIGAAGVLDLTSLKGNQVSGVQNVNISANVLDTGFSDQAIHGDFTATGPEGAWTGLTQLTVISAGNELGADNLTVGPDTAVQITDTVTSATSEPLTVNGSSATTITENNLAANAGVTLNGGIGTTAVSITQTETTVGQDGIVNIVDVNGASKTAAGTITNVTLDGLSHFSLDPNTGNGNDIGPNTIIDNALTDLTVNNSDTTGKAVGLIIADNLTTPIVTTLNLNLSHDGIDASGAATSLMAITDLNNAYSTVHLSLGAQDSSLFLNFNGLTTLDTPSVGSGALLGTPINPSEIYDEVDAPVNFDFSGLNGPNDIAVFRGDTSNADVYTLGNFGGGQGSLVQRLYIQYLAADNTDTINFGSGAYIITDAEHSAASHTYVQTAANGANLANLNLGVQWATIINAHGGTNSDTLTFKTDNVETFVNLGEVSSLQAGIGSALGTLAHKVVEFTFAGNTFIFDHADSSFALTPADAMVELTGIHPIAAVSGAHITFAT